MCPQNIINLAAAFLSALLVAGCSSGANDSAATGASTATEITLLNPGFPESPVGNSLPAIPETPVSSNWGAISGVVDSQHISRSGLNRVYIFSGDVNADDMDGETDPVMVADITQSSGTCTYQYSATGLSEGNYTIAITNEAQKDSPASNDTIIFSSQAQIIVNNGNAITANFPASNILQVGPGKAYSTPSQAAVAVNPGDVIEIDAGIYAGDAAFWSTSDITIRGVGGRAHLKSDGVTAGGKAIWVISGDNVNIENIEFSEASVPDANGAGIRAEGADLSICNSYFHHNENGILGSANGTMVIEFSEFAYNGFGDGFSHNLYITSGDTLIFRHNYSHHAKIGHNLKTRAKNNFILYNSIMDELDGTSSYIIDVPDGGLTYLIGNNLQQGNNTDNSSVIAYGAEGLESDGRVHELYVVNNTIVSDRMPAGSFTLIRDSAGEILFRNNLFVGGAETPNDLNASNVVTNTPGFTNRFGYDYNLTSSSPAINKGVFAGSVRGYDLTSIWQYVIHGNRENRPSNDVMDAGAYEYQQ